MKKTGVWKRYYTDSDKGEDFVNIVSIDCVNKRYILEYGINSLVTDSIDEHGNDIGYAYISEGLFEIIVCGLKGLGYKACDGEE